MLETRKLRFDSEDIGVYIAGDGVYNAPERDYEMVSIPGRNGNLAIDHGRYENITVTYPAFIWANTQEEFREKVAKVRAKLMSKIGYKRLEDTYHPDEYRMAIYMSGLEVEPIFYNRAGRFELSFDCKPQRFLNIGELKRDISEPGDTQMAYGSILHFEDVGEENISHLEVQVDVVQDGSGTPSPTNPRDFTATSEISIFKAKKNLLRKVTTTFPLTNNGITYTMRNDGSITANGTATGLSQCQVGVRFPVRDTLILSGCPEGGSETTYELQMTGGGRTIHDYGGGVMLTPNPDGRTENVYIVIREGQTVSNLNFKPMIRLPEASSIYEAWSGLLYTQTLDTPIYRGLVDYINGVITVTHKLATLDFAGRTGSSGQYRFYSSVIADIRIPANDDTVPSLFCNRGIATSFNDSVNGAEGVSISSDGRVYINFPNLANMTLANARAWLQSNPIQVVYSLATAEVTETTTHTMALFEDVTNLYSRNGLIEMSYEEVPGEIFNPTVFEALPLLEVTGTGTLTVGGTTMTITGDSSQTLYIDCDLMDVYSVVDGAISPANDKVNVVGFPTLESGATGITYEGLSSVKITPRWWIL